MTKTDEALLALEVGQVALLRARKARNVVRRLDGDRVDVLVSWAGEYKGSPIGISEWVWDTVTPLTEEQADTLLMMHAMAPARVAAFCAGETDTLGLDWI